MRSRHSISSSRRTRSPHSRHRTSRIWSSATANRGGSRRGGAPFLAAFERRPEADVDDAYPWTVGALAKLERLQFATPVTFFMGENGAGKSTLLEALAIAVRAVAIGTSDVDADATLDGARKLAAAFVASRRGRPRACSFFRAEDAFGFAGRMAREMGELDAVTERLAGERAEAGRRAAGYVRAQSGALAARYGRDPHAFSHGEAFLGILANRLVPAGLYFLDEPETPLSPTRVLALLASIHAAVRTGSQFVIATHSPILAALPGATILSFDGGAIEPVAYDELEHVRVTREFLASPQRYLRHLLADDA